MLALYTITQTVIAFDAARCVRAESVKIMPIQVHDSR